MKSIVRILTVLFTVFFLITACDKEFKTYEYDENGKPITKGAISFAKIDIKLDLQLNEAVKLANNALAPSVDGFSISILNKRTNEVVGSWLKSELPTLLELRTDTYIMKASYPKTPKLAEWEQPYYYGEQTFEIIEGKTTTIDNLICKLANMKVSVAFGSVFTSQMESYSAIVQNGTGILTFEKEETRSGYFSVASLIVAIKGVRKDGATISETRYISNGAAGDHHKINVDMTMTGNVSAGIIIDATTNDKEIDVTIKDDDIIIDPNPTPNPDPEPDPEQPDVKLPTIAGVGFDITKTKFHTQGTQAVVDVKVTAENAGIQVLKVIIDSPTLSPLLDAQGIPSTLDLTNPTPEVKKLLIELGLITAEPIIGKTEFSFSIGAFMTLLPVGTHKFNVELTDGAGKKAKQALTIVVN